MTGPQETNYARSRQFRQGVVAWLQGHGFPGADIPRRRTPGTPEAARSDVAGLPESWFVDVAADSHTRLSVRLDAAHRDAAEAGAEHAAVVLSRASYGDTERSIGDSFVLVDLHTWASIVRKAERELEAAS